MTTTMPAHSGHYDADAGARYWSFQREVGRFGGWANRSKFEPFLRAGDRVVDFGCGGGYLLAQLPQLEKIGIEVSAEARAEAQRSGVQVVASAAEIPDEWADAIISNHALEHCTDPLSELRALRRILKPGGRVIFVVPCEGGAQRWKPDNINHHLFTWSPLNLGNLFTEAGYTVLESRRYLHAWLGPHRHIARLGGRPAFEAAARVLGVLIRHRVTQVRVVATNP